METAMVDTAARVVELYKSGLGTRVISEQTGVPRSTLRRILQRSGLYVGKDRSRQPIAEVTVPVAQAPIVEVATAPAVVKPTVIEPTGSVMDPSTWASREASCRRYGRDWIIELHGLGGQLACPLPSGYVGKVIRWSASFTLVGPAIGTFELTLSDDNGTDSVSVALIRPYLPAEPGAQWHVVRTIGGKNPRLYIRANQVNSQCVRVSSISTNLR